MQINTSTKDTNKCSLGIIPSLKRNIQKIMHPHKSIKGNDNIKKLAYLMFIPKFGLFIKFTEALFIRLYVNFIFSNLPFMKEDCEQQ